ncbi:MAG: flagellar hook protein FlgE, partial [Desulfohalobiaceae bacterium]
SVMHFEDFMPQDISTSAGVGQVGRGVAVGAVMKDFQQGSLETTNESTDVAIGGDGFFTVSAKGSDENQYTRAGNFRFDEDGYLVDPHGNVVQGWETLEEEVEGAEDGGITAADETGVEIQGVPQDIRLENFQSSPEATSNATMGLNLDTRSISNTEDLMAAWDATEDDQPPIGETQYEYQDTMKIYDENGTSHNMTTYFDKVDPENPPADFDFTDVIDGDEYEGGRTAWQFMVTADPEEVQNSPYGDDASEEHGVLMNGAMIFNSAGEMEEMRFSDETDMQYSQNGSPLAKVDFLDTVEDQTDLDDDGWQDVEINLGLRASSFDDPTADPLVVDDWERQANATTSYSRASTTINQSQDGYTAGYLQNVEVDRDGVLTGRYSNGQVSPLNVLTLANFNNEQGLRKEGGNLYSETRSSGPALTGQPGTNGLGEISSNSLEQSNVDISEEFVSMITTQKGFQANSRTITTTDEMLQEVVNLKR